MPSPPPARARGVLEPGDLHDHSRRASGPGRHPIEYGTTTDYGSSSPENSSLVTSHVQVVSGLAAGTTYHYRVRSTDASGNTATSPDATFVTAGGTSGGASGGSGKAWQGDDVGAIGLPGSDSVTGTTVSVAASGADIWGSEDAFRFRHVELSGDGTITARLTSQQAVDPGSLAGVMIRSSLAADSPHAMLALTPGFGLSFDHRDSRGGETGYVDGGSGRTPIWLRLVRTGDQVVAQQSADGAVWTTVGTATVPLGATALVGLAVASHDNTALGRATFDSVSTAG